MAQALHDDVSVESPIVSSPSGSLGSRWVPRLVARRLSAFAAAVRSNPLVGFLIAFGVVLRVGRYLHDRSLWLDEASLALNLTSRSYSHLVGRLDFDQGAPFGFLMLEKLAISTLGDSERVFRLLPLLAGIASLFVFWRVASRFLDQSSALLALAFFVVLEPFVYYSAETKQYSFDVLVTLVLVLLFDHALSSDRVRPLAGYLVAGLAAPWFSFPSVFVLAGTGAALLLAAAASRNRRKVVLSAGGMIGWLASFAAVYAISIRHFSAGLTGIAQAVTSGHASVFKNVYVLLSEPGAMPRTLIGLAVLLVAVGAATLARDHRARLAGLLLTGLAAAIAGEAHRYPLEGRLALFLVPLELLLLALGAVSLVRLTRMPARALASIAVFILLAAPAWSALRNLQRLPSTHSGTPATLQPTKHLLARLAALWSPGDTLYVSVKSQYAFRYYLTCDDCNPRRAREARLWPFRPVPGPTQTSRALLPERPTLVVGSSSPELGAYLDDFARLRGKRRVWFLFTHTPPVDEGTLEFWLDREGRAITTIREGTAALLLYDLRGKPS